MSSKRTVTIQEKFEVYTTISGSFNKFLPEIRSVMNQMRENNITVLSPRSLVLKSNNSKESGDFVVFEGDTGSPTHIEKKHLQAIAKSDFVYIVNPKGYIGISTALEIGFAISRGIPVYAEFSPADSVFKEIVKSEIELDHIIKLIKAEKRKFAYSTLKRDLNLTDLQNYISHKVKERGFAEEGTLEVMLLFVEEVGELAKSIRTIEAIKVDTKSIINSAPTQNELADCLFYLLDIANLLNINIEKALRHKESTNNNRKWTLPESIKK
jgi:NTP pyrophosphatase (non-canonical NTP hydrolase)/nucleoside 2-deoxyribosyltransferase